MMSRKVITKILAFQKINNNLLNTMPLFDRVACVCDNACKRSLGICRKTRALCPVSRLQSVPIWPACAEQGR